MALVHPHIDKKSHLHTELAILAFAVLFQTFFAGLIAFAGDLTPASIILLTNKERTSHNLEPLAENTSLSKAAAMKAGHMLENDYFAHTSPDGIAPWYWVKEAGYKYQFAGENLAINFHSAEEQEKAWMNSPTHRDNILNKEYTELGVAVVEGNIKGKTSFVTVVFFGQPRTTPLTQPNEEKTFAMAPMVKGVTTEAGDWETESLMAPATLIASALQNIKALLIQNRENIFKTLEVAAMTLVFASLAAPAGLFAALGIWKSLGKTKSTSAV